MKLGDKLVSEGAIDTNQLEEALTVQKGDSSKKLGEILIELGHITSDQLDKVLAS